MVTRVEWVNILNPPMKITLLTPALAAILGLALVSAPVTTHAQTTTATPAPAAATTPAPKKAKPTPYNGSLTAIDTTANTVTVESTSKKDGVKTLTLAITPTTKFENAKKPATLADFVVGDKVTGSYVKNADGSLAAFSLHKGMTKAKTPKAPKAPKPAATTDATPAAAPAPATTPAPAAPAAQ